MDIRSEQVSQHLAGDTQGRSCRRAAVYSLSAEAGPRRTCSGLLPATPVCLLPAAAAIPGGVRLWSDLHPHSGQAAQMHSGVCRANQSLSRVIKPFLQVTKLRPASDLALKATSFKTSVVKKQSSIWDKDRMPQALSKLVPKILCPFRPPSPMQSAACWCFQMELKPPPQTTAVNNSWLGGVSRSLPLSRASPVWPSPCIFQENKSVPSTKAVPGGTAFSCPPVCSSVRSQWPLSRQAQPWWSAILPRLLRNYHSLNLGSGGREGECTGEREQRRKTILSQSHCNRKPRGTHVPSNWQGSWGLSPTPHRQLRSRYCFTEGAPAAPSLFMP